jgi:exonuclease SbcC
VSKLSVRAARRGELAQAWEALAGIVHQIEALPQHDGVETAEEKAERAAIAAMRQAFAAQREGETQRRRDSLNRVDAAIAALPAPFDASQIDRAQSGVEEAQRALTTTEAGYLQAVRDQQAGEALRRRRAAIEARLTALDTRMRRIEDQAGVWTLFAKCMSNDGLIALSIDDSGPTLSSLANDLLLACYGPRFAVSLKTLVKTAKGEAREGFDIVVHDAESGEAKSVTQMSAGERVWINEALTRAIALYLAQNSGRRYETLFSDEADGPLDPERKRMFMAMKREVLRIGGYRQEYFVSQTPELAAMADVNDIFASPDMVVRLVDEFVVWNNPKLAVVGRVVWDPEVTLTATMRWMEVSTDFSDITCNLLKTEQNFPNFFHVLDRFYCLYARC